MHPVSSNPDPEICLPDHFEVLERFEGGEGWSGRVRRTDRPGPDLLLKILDSDGEIDEGSLLASLEHPRLPKILDIGRTRDGRPFLLRSFLTGEPLVSCLPLPLQQVQELARQMLEILAYVHLRSILHLDIKPGNILRSGTERAPEYCLLDFGLGRRGAGEGRGGTPLFASPEQILDLPPDPRSDLFSLGAVLLIALRKGDHALPYGRFLQQFPKQGFFAALDIDPNQLPKPFDSFLPRLLSRRQSNRYQDAQEALEALTGGSGRPTLSVLEPDPISTIAKDLEQRLSAQNPENLVLRGGESTDRNVIALHLACTLSAFDEVRRREDSCLLQSPGASQTIEIELPDLSNSQLSQHLVTATGLDLSTAESVSRDLIRNGKATPSKVGRFLKTLVQSGTILPDGSRWIWPDAISGRWHYETPVEIEASEDSLRRAAASGQPEQALAAYQAATRHTDPSHEVKLRRAMAEGFLLGGEPARALPLVHDAPFLRARCLLELGKVREAEEQIRSYANSNATYATDDEIERLQASIAYARGDFEQAEALLHQLSDRTDSAEDRMRYGFVLSARGRGPEAVDMLQQAVTELDPDHDPYLRAVALTNLGETRRLLGEIEQSMACHRDALKLFQSLGHVRFTAVASSNLGVLAKDLGNYEDALAHQRRARSLYQYLNDDRGAAVAEANIGLICLESGDSVSAIPRLTTALSNLESIGALEPVPLLRLKLARAHAASSDLAKAREYLSSVDEPGKERMSTEYAEVRKLLDQPSAQRPAKPPTPQSVVHPGPVMPGLRSGISREAFQTFVAINRHLASEADLERAMLRLLDSALALTGARIGFVLVCRPDGMKQEFQVCEHPDHDLTFCRSLVNEAIDQGRTLDAQDLLSDEDMLSRPSVRNLKVKSAVCAPFVTVSGMAGALYVEHPSNPGVFDDTVKQFLEVLADQTAIAVERMLNQEQLAAELERSRRELRAVARNLPGRGSVKMLGESPQLRDLRQRIAKLANSELSILILGETGTGKELVARSIHEQSSRSKGPFVAENCSAIPGELMESEFFGHAKGAFTGADRNKRGLLELASGGTMFLDEVGDLPLASQGKLLRAIQEKKIRRVGSSAEIPIDVRLVAATNEDLLGLISEGKFREDLYYRIAAVAVQVPPLRERGEDSLLLAKAFLKRLETEHNRKVTLSRAATKQILSYSWPGNVRELEHLIACSFVLAEGEIESLPLPEGKARTIELESLPTLNLQAAEDQMIQAALESTRGDKAKAARLLGISRSSLYARLRRLDAGTGD